MAIVNLKVIDISEYDSKWYIICEYEHENPFWKSTYIQESLVGPPSVKIGQIIKMEIKY